MDKKTEKKIKLINLNKKDTEKYGFEEVFETDDTEEIRRLPKKCFAIGIVRLDENGNITDIRKNFLSEDLGDDVRRNELLTEMIQKYRTGSIALVRDNVNLMINKEIIPHTVYYVPYLNTEHTSFQSTVVDNIYGASNTSDEVTMELLFVDREDSELSRYATVKLSTKNIYPMELIYDIFEDEDEEELSQLGIKYKKENEDHEEGWCMDFYNEVGTKYECSYPDLESLRDAIVSMRIIGIQHYIDGNPV